MSSVKQIPPRLRVQLKRAVAGISVQFTARRRIASASPTRAARMRIAYVYVEKARSALWACIIPYSLVDNSRAAGVWSCSVESDRCTRACAAVADVRHVRVGFRFRRLLMLNDDPLDSAWRLARWRHGSAQHAQVVYSADGVECRRRLCLVPQLPSLGLGNWHLLAIQLRCLPLSCSLAAAWLA